MVGMGSHPHSYISSDDLESLDLSPPSSSRINSLPLAYSPLSSPSLESTTTASSTTTATRSKRVAFCPLTLLIQCAAEGEKDPALVSGLGQQLQLQPKGRPRIAVRTYSLDTPNLTSATTRAWRSVCAGFNSSLQPLLTPSHSNALRSPSPEREREKNSFATSRSCSDPAVPEFRGRQRKEEEEDVGFISDAAGGEGRGLKIRLPGLTRRCCPSAMATSPPSKGILKPCSFGVVGSPTSSSTATAVDLPSPSAEAESIADPFPPLSPHTSHPSTLPLVSPSLTTITTPAPGDPLIIPLAPCCSSCSAGAEYGRSCSEGEYVEKWSKSARRKRRRDSKAAEERAGMVGWKAAQGGSEKGKAESGESEEEDDVGEGERKGAVVVDEVQCQRMRRGEKDGLEVFVEEGSGEESEEGAESTSPSSEVETTASSTSNKQPTTTTTTAPLTPPMSPETTYTSKQLAAAPPPSLGAASPSPPSPPISPSTETAPPLTTTSTQPSSSTPTLCSAAAPTPPPAPKRKFSLSLPSLLSGAGRGIVEAGMVAGVGGAGGRWG